MMLTPHSIAVLVRATGLIDWMARVGQERVATDSPASFSFGVHSRSMISI